MSPRKQPTGPPDLPPHSRRADGAWARRRAAADRRLHADSGTDAVSSVVSAVLLFALFLAAFSAWTVNSLPGWVAEREAGHSGMVSDRIGGLQAGVEGLSASGQAGPVTATLRLAPEPVPLVQSSTATGRLSLVPDAASWDATLENPQLHVRGGAFEGGVDAQPGGGPFGPVAGLEALQLRLTTSSVGPSEQAYVEAVATDGTRTVTARLVHVGSQDPVSCSSSEVRLDVTDGSTRRHVLLCGADSADHTLDLLAPVYGFHSALAGLEEGYTIQVDQDAPGGAAVGAFGALWRDADGRSHVAGSGAAGPATLSVSGSALRHEALYQEIPAQTRILGLGGVALQQPEGSAFASDPAFDLQRDGGEGWLTWTVLDLSGSGSIDGSEATVRMGHEATSRSVQRVDGATFTVTGEDAGAWRSLWRAQALAAGATDVVTVGGSGDTATLELDGATWLLDLRIVQVRASIS